MDDYNHFEVNSSKSYWNPVHLGTLIDSQLITLWFKTSKYGWALIETWAVIRMNAEHSVLFHVGSDVNSHFTVDAYQSTCGSLIQQSIYTCAQQNCTNRSTQWPQHHSGNQTGYNVTMLNELSTNLQNHVSISKIEKMNLSINWFLLFKVKWILKHWLLGSPFFEAEPVPRWQKIL